jgi:cytochrome c oxidase subunit 4
MEHDMDQSESRGPIISYPTFIYVWLLLLLLTAVLVSVSRLFHEAMAVWAMLILTPLKAGLVLFYFMHLKYEKTFLKAMVITTLGILALFIGLTFSDISYR